MLIAPSSGLEVPAVQCGPGLSIPSPTVPPWWVHPESETRALSPCNVTLEKAHPDCYYKAAGEQRC